MGATGEATRDASSSSAEARGRKARREALGGARRRAPARPRATNGEARARAGARAAAGRAATGRAAATVSIVACGVTRESVVGGSTRARMCVARGDRTRVYPIGSRHRESHPSCE
jgi:hypothetical protein